MSNLIDDNGNDQFISYEELISSIEIDRINVRRLNMESFISPNELRDLSANDDTIDITITQEFKLERNDQDKKIFFAVGSVQATARLKEIILFLVDVELSAEYNLDSVEKEISEEVYDRFVSSNVPVNIWPYAREIIHTGTIRMGYPPLVLKPYRVIV